MRACQNTSGSVDQWIRFIHTLAARIPRLWGRYLWFCAKRRRPWAWTCATQKVVRGS